VPTAIPDAFNGDFSNLLKVDIKPHTTTSAPKQTAPKKAPSNVGNKKTSNNDESSDVATKLELAIAYIDMADKEGALELLAEALIEGGPQQRERAQSLIDSLA
jgi:pilus assembly protein FimV